ncbi:glutamine--tRNA ligase/YqeY domain fusion protein [Candidatus Xianfuyuplasma coldseepsis]|uniref:Glutamine--tRNA ligase n=1 Tax=Candidatus Xianfuyuplasma coldseepsis TaxID=2782163 RepID=A0A7L7KRQ8_9MOLU|nr:glutamine--tRNA ligase/YqeY domain fusion protein [Xianfuyuplasma coldseepsis]QMS84886.1 glutamine--tRNA ligase/YqeY domain fusion protein [Xianfuyuplasma coldseepsis]
MEINHFINTIIEEDIRSGKHEKAITRFPPEPNGLLHLGHARAIITNYTMAQQHGGYFNLRFDDTNPVKEDTVFVEGIKKDIAWLGCHWKNLLFASDYFDEMYKRALLLIEKGDAYVDDLSAEEIREYRGDFTTPGKESPYRNRSIKENMDLFIAMKDGQFDDGSRVLRAKIDMASPNINLRDPVIYRIQRATHHNTGDKWCIYPMYDYAHPIEDAIEGITHSLCSLEFEDHRPLYDWVVEHCEMEEVPRQIEFGKLYIAGAVTGKRYIKQLVEEGLVMGWDDPRLITLSGLRRRGIPPMAIHDFIIALGLPKSQGETEIDMLYQYVRDHLKHDAPVTFAVLDPLKLVIDNYPEGQVEYLDVVNNRENPDLGSKSIPFSREVYIEREDFIEQKPNKKWRRLALDVEVRLMHAYFVKANSVVKDDDGNIIEVHCTYDPNTKSGSGFNDRKPNGNIHFVDATHNKKAEIRLFDELITDMDDKDTPFREKINPESLIVKEGFIEEHINPNIGDTFQFARNGYYSVDSDTTKDYIVFNRVVELRSSYKPKAK